MFEFDPGLLRWRPPDMNATTASEGGANMSAAASPPGTGPPDGSLTDEGGQLYVLRSEAGALPHNPFLAIPDCDFAAALRTGVSGPARPP